MDPLSKRIEGARDYDQNNTPREMWDDALKINTSLLGAASARVEYLQKMIEEADPLLTQQGPSRIPELRKRLAEAVRVKE
jgi:hypothetical protein